MDLFTIDTEGEHSLLHKNDKDEEKPAIYDTDTFREAENSDEESEDDDDVEQNDEESEDESSYDYAGIPPPSVDIFDILRNPKLYNKPLIDDGANGKTKPPSDLDVFFRAMGWTTLDGVLYKKPADKKPLRRWEYEEIDLNGVHHDLEKTNVEKEMKTSTLKGIEKKRDIKILREREAARKRKEERSKTKGKSWYMPATEVTEELRQDMEIIQMHSVLNPTHFYKKNDLKTLPKFFQVGKVLPSPLERQEPGVRVSKKRTLVDELLADAEFQQFNKRKYNEVIAEKKRNGFKKAYKKMKKSKKKS